MNGDASWDRIVDAIEAKFGIDEHGRGKRPLPDTTEHEEKFAFIVFSRGNQRFKLERTTGPAIAERKVMGAKRIGASLTYHMTYDPTEIAHKTHFFREDGADWMEMDPSALDLS